MRRETSSAPARGASRDGLGLDKWYSAAIPHSCCRSSVIKGFPSEDAQPAPARSQIEGGWEPSYYRNFISPSQGVIRDGESLIGQGIPHLWRNPSIECNREMRNNRYSFFRG